MGDNLTAVNPEQLKEILRHVVKSKASLIIKGAPGIGKTAIVEEAVKELGYEFMAMYPAISSPTDFLGHPVYDDTTKTARFVPYGNLERLINATQPIVVLLDDFGFASPSVQAASMHLLAERRVGDNAISDHVNFIIATNDKGQHAGVNSIIEPVKSRPVSIVELKPDVDMWINWANKNNIRPELIGFIKFRPHLLHAFTPTSEMTNSPSPRTCVHVSQILDYNLKDDTRFAMIAGAVGSGFAYEFDGFLRMFEGLVDPEELLNNPENVDLSAENPAILCAYCSIVTSKATRDNMASVIRFAERLPNEYMVKLVAFDILGKDQNLSETKAYITWTIKNQELLAA